MSSKLVTNSGKLGIRVAANTADRNRNQRAMLGVIGRCRDVVPEGTTSLTLEEAQYYVGQQIAYEIAEASAHDDEHVGQQVSVYKQQVVRDRSFGEVYGLMLKARDAVKAIYGEAAAIDLLGRNTKVPTDPFQLHQTAARCRRWLLAPEFALSEKELAAFDFDPVGFAESMADPVERLGLAILTLPDERVHAIDTQVAKNAKVLGLQELIGQGARLLEALYDLGGMAEESDRIRPSSHVSTATTPPATESAPTETPAAETAPTPGEATPAEAPPARVSAADTRAVETRPAATPAPEAPKVVPFPGSAARRPDAGPTPDGA